MPVFRRLSRLGFVLALGLVVAAVVVAQPPTELPPIPPIPPQPPTGVARPAIPMPTTGEPPGRTPRPSVPAAVYEDVTRPAGLPPVAHDLPAIPPTSPAIPPAPVSPAGVMPQPAPPAQYLPPPNPNPPPVAIPTPTPPVAQPQPQPQPLVSPAVLPQSPPLTPPVSSPVVAIPPIPAATTPTVPAPKTPITPPAASAGPLSPAMLPAPTRLAPNTPGLPGTGAPARLPDVKTVTQNPPPPPGSLMQPAPVPGTSAGVCDPAPRRRLGHKGLVDSLHCDDNYGFKALFDSLHPKDARGEHWYEKLSLRGYTQVRYGRSLYQDAGGADPFIFGDRADPVLLGDRSINGSRENFSIRRMRLIFSGDVSDHLGIYLQPDFTNNPSSTSPATFFGQLRDAYADVYLDTTKIHRFRVGLSKIPYGWENMQSSQNRVPLDRTDAINTGASPNERDLGVFYYWTPESKQRLLRDLVDGGLKGSGNYGILGLGVYNGQGGSQLEQNLNLHTVARVTWPFRLASGQVVEASLQGYTGEIVVPGADISPLGVGDPITPAGTGGTDGFRDQRVAATFVWYPQPFGFQAEWNYGEGPGLDDSQQFVRTRPLNGGYVMAMYKHDTQGRLGIITPYARWQYYEGGYRSVANAPYGTHTQWDLGVEWQMRKEMELVLEYSFVNGVNLNAIDRAGAVSYRNFDGGVLRCQFQFNY